MTGLFFCLASAEGAGLLFCPATIQPHTSVYSGFYIVHAVYTANATKQRTGLYRGVPCYLPCFSVVVWRCIQLYRTTCDALERITAPGRAQQIPDTSAAPDAVQLSTTALYSRPIIIRYIRAHRLLWIHARQCNRLQIMQARRGQRLHLYRVSPAGSQCFPRLALA